MIWSWGRAIDPGMWPYHPDLLATPVPRYTSFPTAAEFGPLAPEPFLDAIEQADGDVSLYLHIPYCEQICHYCGCNTGRANRRQRLESYLAALHREIDLVGGLLPAGARVRRIAFGGGSPNAVAADEFLALAEALDARFPLANPVWSIELDPRTLTGEWLLAMKSIGIERASLGVQTFATHCQQAIGRVQPEELIVRAVDGLRDAGVASLNFDLMYGLPGQSRDDLEDTLRRSHVLGADRVALFGYAHVPHIVPRQMAIDASKLPGQEERFDMAAFGHRYLVTHGYIPVGFDHFARADQDPLAAAATGGALRRNFQGFTDDKSEVLIGLGSSAISSFPDLLAQNEKNSGRYRMLSSQGLLSCNRGVRRTADDRYRGAVIEQLLCGGKARIGARLQAEVTDALQPFIERRLASFDGKLLSIEADGLPYARTIAALFDPYRKESARRFSSAV